jgi:excisionase family DNA binding protein
VVRRFPGTVRADEEHRMMNDERSANGALLLRAEEVGHLLGIGRSKVYELIAAGELPVVEVGRSLRVNRLALERWVEARTSGGGAEQEDRGPRGG